MRIYVHVIFWSFIKLHNSFQSRSLTSLERRSLCGFLLQTKWFTQSGALLTPRLLNILKHLPIFTSFPEKSTPATAARESPPESFTTLLGGDKYIPPPEAAGMPLGNAFIQVRICYDQVTMP